jgi:hypothetical protein
MANRNTEQRELFHTDGPAGQIAMFPEKQPCFCRKQDRHFHANEYIYDGSRWVPSCSQAGIEARAKLRHGNP